MASYLNPEAFIPATPVPLGPTRGGMIQQEKLGDYRRLMEEQYAMQEIERNRARLELENKQKDVPVQDLEREYKTKGYLGKIPYAQQEAEAKAKAGIAESEYTQLSKGKEGQQQLREEWRDKLDARERTRMEHESKIMLDIIDKGQALGPQWIQQQIERGNKLGYKLPSQLMDPQAREIMRAGLLENMSWLKTKQEEEFKNKLQMQRDAANNASRERTAAMIAAARERAAGSKGTDKPKYGNNFDQAIAIATQRASRASSKEQYDQEWAIFESSVSNAIVERAGKNFQSPEASALRAYRAGNEAPMAALIEKYKEQFPPPPKAKGTKQPNAIEESAPREAKKPSAGGTQRSVDDLLKKYGTNK